MRRTAVAAFVAIGFSSASIISTALADDLYAAFAVVPKFGAKYHGYARGQTREVARMFALRDCANPRCRVLQEYKIGQCAHIFLGKHQVFWNNPNVPPNSTKADMAAHCERYDIGCKAIVSECLR